MLVFCWYALFVLGLGGFWICFLWLTYFLTCRGGTEWDPIPYFELVKGFSSFFALSSKCMVFASITPSFTSEGATEEDFVSH